MNGGPPDGPVIRPHPYVQFGERWERCADCGLAEAAHDVGMQERYSTSGRYRCPYCVGLGAAYCSHEKAPLGMDGAPL